MLLAVSTVNIRNFGNFDLSSHILQKLITIRKTDLDRHFIAAFFPVIHGKSRTYRFQIKAREIAILCLYF